MSYAECGDGGGLVLGRLDLDATTGFGRGSAIRRVGAEPAVSLLLLRTLTMEVAHAKVGAGVSEHSAVDAHPFARGLSTADAAVRLVWGDPAVSRRAARQVYRIHDHVQGDLPEPSPAWPYGGMYTAHDASLLLWVWATLLEAALVAHRRWLRPLEGTEGAEYYADMASFARFFGIPPSLIPPDRRAFDEYFEAVVAGNALLPTPTSTAMVRKVLWLDRRHPTAVALRPARVLAIGTLDPRMRERFGLRLSSADRRLFEAIDGSLGRFYRYRPAWAFQQLPTLYLALQAARRAIPVPALSRPQRRAA